MYVGLMDIFDCQALSSYHEPFIQKSSQIVMDVYKNDYALASRIESTLDLESRPLKYGYPINNDIEERYWPRTFSIYIVSQTRSSAITQEPRDALRQLKSCQLLQSCTKNHI